MSVCVGIVVCCERQSRSRLFVGMARQRDVFELDAYQVIDEALIGTLTCMFVGKYIP